MAKEFKPETEKCPVCDTKWTKTSFGSKTWYDCSPCNKTAEDIVVLKSSSSSGTKEYKLGNLEEWENFIDTLEFDDDFDLFIKKSRAEKVEICNELIKQGIITTPDEYLAWIGGV